ncbi:MAG TPA: hypothetical protein VGO85_07305 [Caldimonas sp.]|nr:hypothetical protein [Caldimonas sp.]
MVDPLACTEAVLALDLGTVTGWALRTGDGRVTSGSQSFKPDRSDGGGLRFLRFRQWLTEIDGTTDGIGAIYFEEVRRHLGVSASHAYGGFVATLTTWAEDHEIPYRGVRAGTIKRHVTGKGNANKLEVIAGARALGFAPCDANEAEAIALLSLVALAPGGERS